MKHLFDQSEIKNEGSGPGAQTRDGCSVEFYRQLQPQGEPELVADHLAPGATLLELGCGPGRLTHPLVAQGYQVTAVDNSAEMLSHIVGATPILADIESLRLSQFFDGVLFASHLINVPSDQVRRTLLESAAYHLKEDGILFIQRHDPEVFVRLSVGLAGEQGRIKTFVDQLTWHDQVATMTLRWEIDNKSWTQSFQTRMLSEAEVEAACLLAGLQVTKWIDSQWCLARRQTGPISKIGPVSSH